MIKLKSHKTVEQIAKKHRLDVSFIQKQLDMGVPIEHEHTKNHDLARRIALQHLDEIPDYYSKLKKMESDSKKSKSIKEGNLHQWFKGSKSKDGKHGWVNVVTGGTCASDEPGEGTPKCVSSRKRASMTKAERISASKRKKAADPRQQEKSNAAKPTYVSTDKPKKMNEEKDKKSKKSGTKDACYHKVRSSYDVWPSAYASGALVKCRKAGASNWGTKSEETMHEEERYCPLCQKRETRSECSYGEKVWDKISVKDEEYSMARSELNNINNAVKRLQNVVGRGEGNLEAWVQSKITKAADYIDTAADYLEGEEMKEGRNPLKDPRTKITRSTGAGALTPQAAAQLGDKAVQLQKKAAAKVSLPKLNKEQKIVDKILNDIREENPCWKGYKKVGMKKKKGKLVPNCVPLKEATRLQAETGNIMAITLSWRGKYYTIQMFFPQAKIPSRKDITYEIQKIYPESKVIHSAVSQIKPGEPLVRVSGGSYGYPGPSKNYVKPMGEEVEIYESKVIDKSTMKCNKPKAQAVGDSLTGKSHVVKACEGGKEKIIRFGQRGVKGSPKKRGESKSYANRRKRFKARHARNIAKGKMSAAFWANKVKW